MFFILLKTGVFEKVSAKKARNGKCIALVWLNNDRNFYF